MAKSAPAKLPRVVIHNSVSLDMSLTGFDVDMMAHYSAAERFHAKARLIGSRTILAGIEAYGEPLPEEPDDLIRKKRPASAPYWVVVDSSGALEGKLHLCRRFEGCRDVVVLVSKKTPASYLRHLDEREYRHHCTGERNVDLAKALALLRSEYGAEVVMADTGRILSNLLLEKGLASEVSLLVHPFVVGNEAYRMFEGLYKDVRMSLVSSARRKGGLVWLRYAVEKAPSDKV